VSEFVLVHGAWHGGWCWERVAERLRDGGHRVHAPTLTGLSERADELTPAVGLPTHVDDVLCSLAAAGGETVLVGHSYGALVAQAAAARAPERVRHVVYVEGWVGPDGSSLLSLAPEWFGDGVREAADRDGDGWRIPPPAPIAVGVSDPEDAAWLQARLTDHPLRTLCDPAANAGARMPSASAIVAPQGAVDLGALARAMSLPVVEMQGGHDLMVTSPEQLTAALLEAA
jgi:pimeloyl-ACP methyl ester carboxylesterase